MYGIGIKLHDANVWKSAVNFCQYPDERLSDENLRIHKRFNDFFCSFFFFSATLLEGPLVAASPACFFPPALTPRVYELVESAPHEEEEVEEEEVEGGLA